MRRAIREQLGYEFPDDLEALTDRTWSIRGPCLQLELPTTMDDTELSSVEPIGEVYQIGGSQETFWFLEPTPRACRVWWMSQDPLNVVLAARDLLEYLEQRLAFLRQYRDFMEAALLDGELDESVDGPQTLEPNRDYTIADARRLDPDQLHDFGFDLDDLPTDRDAWFVGFDFRDHDPPVGLPWHALTDHQRDAPLVRDAERFLWATTIPLP